MDEQKTERTLVYEESLLKEDLPVTEQSLTPAFEARKIRSRKDLSSDKAASIFCFSV